MDTDKDGETIVYVFYWYIENFRCYWKENAEALRSPPFCTAKLQNTQWKLIIMRQEKPNEVSLVLCLNREEDNGPLDVVINFELGFVREDESVITEWPEKKFKFSKKMWFGPECFAIREEQFSSKYSLIARCRLWQSDTEVTEIRKQFVKTIINFHQRSFVWGVENFSRMNRHSVNTLEVVESSGIECMILKLLLEENYNCEVVFLCINLMTWVKQCLATFKLYLIDKDGNKIECSQSLCTFTNYVFLLFSKDEILQNKDIYLKNDTLSLHCEFNFNSGIPLHSAVTTTCEILNPRTKIVCLEALPNINTFGTTDM